MTDFAQHLEIQNPNSCKQGFCPNHANNPHHTTLTERGWNYSHTTPICTMNGGYYAHHTYKFPGSDWAVGVDCRPGWAARAGRIGSGRHTTYFTHSLKTYLKRKTKELRKNT